MARGAAGTWLVADFVTINIDSLPILSSLTIDWLSERGFHTVMAHALFKGTRVRLVGTLGCHVDTASRGETHRNHGK